MNVVGFVDAIAGRCLLRGECGGCRSVAIVVAVTIVVAVVVAVPVSARGWHDFGLLLGVSAGGS